MEKKVRPTVNACHADNTVTDGVLDPLRGVSEIPTDEPEYFSVVWVWSFVYSLSVLGCRRESEYVKGVENQKCKY